MNQCRGLRFFSAKAHRVNILGLAGHTGSWLNPIPFSLSYVLFFTTPKNINIILICKASLKNSPRGLDLAHGYDLLTPIFGNTILKFKTKYHCLERGVLNPDPTAHCWVHLGVFSFQFICFPLYLML